MISMGPVGVFSIERTCISRAPPPSLVMTLSTLLASARSVLRLSRMALAAVCRLGMSVTWIWPIIMGSSLEVVNPSPSRNSRAALLAAAITDGSSIAIGIK